MDENCHAASDEDFSFCHWLHRELPFWKHDDIFVSVFQFLIHRIFHEILITLNDFRLHYIYILITVILLLLCAKATYNYQQTEMGTFVPRAIFLT